MTIAFGSNTLIESQDASSSFYSDIITLSDKEGFSIHILYEGSPIGELTVESSINNVDWVAIFGSYNQILEAGDIFYNISHVNFLYARLCWTTSSGTGTFRAYHSAKRDL